MMEALLMGAGYDRFLRTLCNRTRLAVIQALATEAKNVSELTVELQMHQTTVSHALARLLRCGFVRVRQEGKQRIYSLNRQTIQPLVQLIEKHVRLYCGGCD